MVSASAVRVDPVTFQVIVSRLSGIVQEMQDNIFRTGYSAIVRESHDASCLLLDAGGEVIGEHTVAALHLTALPGVVRAIRRRFGDDLHPGDAFITNHPYEADVPHSVDMACVMPVFAAERPGAPPVMVAFAASIAHKSDLGGMVPGTANGGARDAFQEGIFYPPVRFVRAGTIVRDLEAILRANSRTPDTIIGDLRGQVGVARLGERRLHEVIDRYGLDAVLAVFAEKLDRTEQRMRAVLAAFPDGVSEASNFLEDDGTAGSVPAGYHVRVEKRGGQVTFDFTGSSDQVTMPINIHPALVRGCCYFALMGMFDSTIENNGGLARVVDIRVRPGSILDSIFPAPTNTYLPTATAITEIIVEALGKLVPDRQVAGVGGVGTLSIGGRRSTGELFSSYEPIGSAYGARTGRDGLSGMSVFHSNANAAPMEILEAEFPFRFNRLELIRDSGGAGSFRGGLGMVREYTILAPAAQITLRGGKHVIAATGVSGGGPARMGACVINPGTPREKRMASRFGGEFVRAGDVVRIEKSGGGGVGPASKRSFERVLDDVLDGYVSRDAAIRDYGVDAERLDAAIAQWNK